MKTCSKCSNPKDSSEFSFSSASPDKLQNYCKLCSKTDRQARRSALSEEEREGQRAVDRVAQRQRYLKNPEHVRAIARKNRNREKDNERSRKYRQAHLEEVKKANKEWVKNNPEKVKANRDARYNRPGIREEKNKKAREHYQKPGVREARSAAGKERYKNPEVRAAICEKAKERRHTDPYYRLVIRLRARLNSAVNAAGAVKSAKTIELLGAPWVWVEVHLESLFKPGMTWENHGPVWHIDHIRPCASFDLTISEQQRMCFHWTNLQPLFALDNLRKSDKYDPQVA